MDLYTKVQGILEGAILIAIGCNFIYSIFKRDMANFLKVLVLCCVAYLFVHDPKSFTDLLLIAKDFIADTLGGVTE